MTKRRLLIVALGASAMIASFLVLTKVAGWRESERVETVAIIIVRDGVSNQDHVVSCSERPGYCSSLLELFTPGPRIRRCLEIWGGAEFALLRISNRRIGAITRANSCQIRRWKELRKILRHLQAGAS